jgi:N-acetyl-anhydromuramyl-L-alanine amidase AmpD
MGQFWPLADEILERLSPNHSYPGQYIKPRAVTHHITEGSLDSALGWLTDPASNASCNFVVSRLGGIYMLVPPWLAAWCQGKVEEPDRSNPIVRETVDAGVNPNLRSWSIEHVGFTSNGRGGSLTQAQRAASERLTAYLCYRGRLSCDLTHILTHSQWDSVGRPHCPGFSAAERQSMVERSRALCALWRGW